MIVMPGSDSRLGHIRVATANPALHGFTPFSRMFYRLRFCFIRAAGLAVIAGTSMAVAATEDLTLPATDAANRFYRPFLPTSRWRKQLGAAPVHTHNAVYLENMMSTDPDRGGSVTRRGVNVPYLLLNGADPDNLYAQGLAEADATSARYKLLYYDDGSSKGRHAVFHHRDHVAVTRGLDGKGGVRVPNRLRVLYDMTNPQSI